MAFSIKVFDGTELISFAVAFIALVVIIYLYFLKKPSKQVKAHLGRQSKNLIFLIFLFIFFNRFFTNVEAIAYKELFNLLEHLSSLTASLIALRLSWMVMKGGSNH